MSCRHLRDLSIANTTRNLQLCLKHAPGVASGAVGGRASRHALGLVSSRLSALGGVGCRLTTVVFGVTLRYCYLLTRVGRACAGRVVCSVVSRE